MFAIFRNKHQNSPIINLQKKILTSVFCLTKQFLCIDSEFRQVRNSNVNWEILCHKGATLQ